MLAEEVLMVNDGSLLLKLMGSLLEGKGYHISLTDSPEEALVLLSTRNIVLVVMKLNGQQTDRLAVAHMVRELNGGTQLIILGESTHLPVEIFELEADDYILMPCRASEIWRRLLSSLKTATSQPIRTPKNPLKHPVNPRPYPNSRYGFHGLCTLFNLINPGMKIPGHKKTEKKAARWRPFAKHPPKAG